MQHVPLPGEGEPHGETCEFDRRGMSHFFQGAQSELVSLEPWNAQTEFSNAKRSVPCHVSKTKTDGDIGG